MKHLLRSCVLACCGAMAALVVACGSKSDYRELLPADSFVTVSVRPSSLSAKSGAGDITQNPLYTRLVSELKALEGLTPDEKEYVLTLLRTPEESGIEMDKDQFLFISADLPADGSLSASMSQRVGVLLPLGDRAKFETLIGHICQKGGFTVETKHGVNYFVLGTSESYSGVCAYDDRAVLIYMGTGSVDAVCAEVAGLFTQKRSESLLGKADFAKQFDRENDINLVVSYAGMTSLFNHPMLSSLPMIEAMKSMTVVGSVNFVKGEIVSDFAAYYADAESERLIKEGYAYLTAQKGDLLRYVPASSMAVMGFGLDGEKLLEFVSSLPGGAMLVASPQVVQVMKAFAGDVAVSFSGMSLNGRYPVGSVLAKVDDPSAMDTIVANLAGLSVQKSGAGAYSLAMKGALIQFGVKDDIFYLTTDPTVKAALDGKSFESCESLKKIFEKQISTFYLDFEKMNAQLKAYLGSEDEMQDVLSILGLFDELEAYGTMESGRMVVRMTDREQNALKSICDTVNALIVRYLPAE